MASTLRATGAVSSWVRSPGRLVNASPALQQQVHFPIRNNRSTLRIRRRSSQENTVSTQSEETPNAPEEEKPSSKAQTQEEQKQIGEALKELRGKTQDSFWDGLLQEIGLIEWPDFGRVLGTTLVVLGIIFGSSIVLLTVNFLLAQLSDIVFKVQSTS